MSRYVPGTQQQVWKIVALPNSDTEASHKNIRLQSALSKTWVLSLDGYGIYSVAGLIVLDKVMHMLSETGSSSDGGFLPCELFSLICGASSGGLIAILLGRLGLDCATARRVYMELLTYLSKDDTTSKDSFIPSLRQVIKRYGKQRHQRMEVSEGVDDHGDKNTHVS